MTPNDLALVKKHLDDIESEDYPAGAHPHALTDALDAVLAQATRFPGVCEDCRHFDTAASAVAKHGFCTNALGHHTHRLMPEDEGCTKWVERADDSWAV
ncbi:MAG: hypothetical protein KAY59_04410 [Acidobacteria bacterium]|nr:hypothetical protein [Acidobacteriota bacterium]